MLANFSSGPFNLPLMEGAFNLSFLRIDLVFTTLSTVMLAMIGLLFAVIGQYAYHYLDRQHRQSYFFSNFLGVFFSVSLMVLTSNLFYVLVSWVLTSVFLSRLLLYNEKRFQAQLAVKKKFWISRLGDLFLLLAVLMIYKTLGTLEFTALREAVTAENSPTSPLLGVGIGMLCLSCLVKSVQFPFHIWLPETMETPAPVSAIMHAGVVNSGGYLLIRASEVLELFPAQLIFLAYMGAFSAVFGSLVMLTQNDIKKNLPTPRSAKWG